jgi:sulfatase modifying factor 1
MPVKKALITLLFLFFSAHPLFAQSNSRERIRIRPVLPYNHPTLNAPPGMVYIRGGSTTIRYNQSSTDTNSVKKVSLTSFFIDKTEITNQQYRQFIEWVIDSIAVVKYLKDDKYFLSDKASKDKEDEKKDADVPPPAAIDSTAVITDSTSVNLAATGSPDSSGEAITDRRIDWSKVNHKRIFESRDPEIKAKIKPLLDENGDIRKDAYVFSFRFIRASNIAGAKKSTRKMVTEGVSVYPEEKVWAEDMVNSQTELLVENYFKVVPYDDYPVVGVNWKAARSFAYWRSINAQAYTGMPEYMKYYRLTYSLPSEAQWVYAAQGYFDMIASNQDTAGDTTKGVITGTISSDSLAVPHDSAYVASLTIPQKPAGEAGAEPEANLPPIVDSTPIHNDNKGLLANFKQDEGDYWEDGSALTLPVMAFAPNEFGLYNMEGNVAEWMLDAYSPSTFSFVSDLNPVLLYDADSADADAMKRKVIRGGSFISNAKTLSPYNRDLELETIAHCYVGFRCVMPAPELLYPPVSTRRKRLQSPNMNRAVRNTTGVGNERNIVKRNK